MAQFTAHGQGRLKPLGVETKDTYHGCKLGGGRSWPIFHIHNPKLSSLDSTRLYFSSANARSNHFNAQAHLNMGDNGIYEDDVRAGDGDFEMDELACFRGLVLDISYRPVNVVCWKRAICLEFMEKLDSLENEEILYEQKPEQATVILKWVDVLEYYDQTVNSPSGSFYIPAVLRVPHLLQVVKRRRIKNNLSRKNILYRDNFTCQYCSSRENLTIDHILPISRGGEWKWENLVAACAKCNSKKGQKTLEEASMKLTKVPKSPKDYDILAIPLTNMAIRMLRMRKGTPEEWRQYLGKPSSEP